jgi:hypothetical protein
MELKNSSNLLFRTRTGGSSLEGKNLPNTSLKLEPFHVMECARYRPLCLHTERERERERGACEEFGFSTKFVHVDFEQWLGR